MSGEFFHIERVMHCKSNLLHSLDNVFKDRWKSMTVYRVVFFWGGNSIFCAISSKYLRFGKPRLQELCLFNFSYKPSCRNLSGNTFDRGWRPVCLSL